MNISKKKYYIIILALISFILLVVIFNWIDYLVQHKYIVENFEQTNSSSNYDNNNINQDSSNNILQSSLTSHTVDLPLTTTYSCNNFCGPPSRCSITGHQCTSDIDCPGCLPYKNKSSKSSVNIPGNNDAGKLTFGTTPRYSTLTTDIGTQARLITSNKFSRPAMADFGVNTWRSSFNKDEKQFNSVYKPKQLQNMPTYKTQYSLSGEFIDEGPLPSNAYLS